MLHHTKIATCSYCGRRQTLRPLARDGHELACGACGAPLHEMKWLKAPEAAPAKSGKKAKKRSEKRKAPHAVPVMGHGDDWARTEDWRDDPRRRNRRKKRKGLFSEILEEAFDVIEDIFD